MLSDSLWKRQQKEMLAQLVDEDTELISLYYGQDVQEESAENLHRRLKIYIRM